MSPQTRANSAPLSSATPARSNEPAASSSRDSRITHRPTSSATSPSGAFRKNTDSQLTFSTSSPATIGPPAMEIPTVDPQMPIAALSRSAGNVLRSRARLAGCRSAPANPCTTRQKITMPSPPESPISTDDTANPTTPARKVRLRPNRSAIFPAGISVTASASR